MTGYETPNRREIQRRSLSQPLAHVHRQPPGSGELFSEDLYANLGEEERREYTLTAIHGQLLRACGSIADCAMSDFIRPCLSQGHITEPQLLSAA